MELRLKFKEKPPHCWTTLQNNISTMCGPLKPNSQTKHGLLSLEWTRSCLKLGETKRANANPKWAKTTSYQKSGRLSWETNGFELLLVVTKNGASAPEPIKLTIDVCYSFYVKYGSKASGWSKKVKRRIQESLQSEQIENRGRYQSSRN